MITHGVVDIAAVAISRCIIGFQTEDCGVGSNSVFSSACCGHDVADVAKGINGNLFLSRNMDCLLIANVLCEEFFENRVFLFSEFWIQIFQFREMFIRVSPEEIANACHRGA